jgi:hypothetical protein
MTETRQEFERLLRYLQYTLHELPTGVLYDANGADEEKCAELMKETYRLEALAAELAVDCAELVDVCRWHYERYPHYLSRHRHFGSYANYIAKHQGPSRVGA